MSKKVPMFVLAIMEILLCFTSGKSSLLEDKANLTQKYSQKSLENIRNRTVINIGNWSYWMYNDGTSGVAPNGEGGGIYPRGTALVIYQDGLVWGCFVEGETMPRVGGQTYRTGTQPGWIVTAGDGTNPPVAVDPNDARARIYRIRPDWRTLSHLNLLEDAVDVYLLDGVEEVTEEMTAALLEQYKTDWKDWPVDLGAPYVDKNNNGIYDPLLDDEGYPIYSDVADYPGIAQADQVVWLVCNDLDATRAQNLYGSGPIGLELQVTAWMYNQPENALGQTIFKRYRLINKSGKRLDSMYVAQWSDCDVGDYSDDLVGCDTLLNLGFAYNGRESDELFAPFNLPPPAFGYDFLQGPIVRGRVNQDRNRNGIDDAQDFAVHDFKRIGPGFINLPMTAFGYFPSGNPLWSDPVLGTYQGTLQWYNLLRGFQPHEDIDHPVPFYTHSDPKNGKPTKFCVAGDPVNGNPLIDDIDGAGPNFAPGARRFAMSSGPFVMQPGDTQDVLVAVVGGLADSRLHAIVDLKGNDLLAQGMADSQFQEIPKPPTAPKVKVTGFENEIVLNWGWDHAAVKETEDKKIINYEFEGYNVYQLPTPWATKKQAVRVATFDRENGVRAIRAWRFDPKTGVMVNVVLQLGRDSGIQRYFVIDHDYLTGEPLYPGNTYYFAVTAYNYDPNLLADPSLESALTVIPVTTQSPPPGVRYSEEIGDTLEVTHQGESDGRVLVTVVDPSQVTGHDYEIFFTEDTDTGSATYGMLRWNLRDVTNGQIKLENQPQLQRGEDEDAPIVDGLLIKVIGKTPGIEAILEVVDAHGPVTWEQNVWHTLSSPRDPNRFYISVGGGCRDLQGMGRHLYNAPSHDFEMRFTDQGGIFVWWYENNSWAEVPFEFWDIGIGSADDPSDDIRCLTGGYSGGKTPGVFDFAYTDPAFGYPASDWIYVRMPQDSLGSYQKFYEDVTSGALTFNWWDHSKEVLSCIIICDFGGAGTLPEPGVVLRWITSKPNTTEDIFTFSTGGVIQSQELAREDVEKITVYPNPYYAGNPQELDRYQHFVTFYHLPRRAKIRIFNLGGQLVRTLEKSDDSQFLRWDLLNAAGLPVASGIYLAHIQMPDLGKEKVVKIAIIQPAQILEYY